uniref:Uncharacterized protein n=1 Tax=Romanomermis culicivorax TaxID=13658 RepID=A0A915KYL7_ROMCU
MKRLSPASFGKVWTANRRRNRRLNRGWIFRDDG